MSAQICKVCELAPSKYKCPHCELRYCSIPCFKQHLEAHEAGDVPATSANVEIIKSSVVEHEEAKNENGAQSNPYLALQNHPQFQPLFTRYPQLKAQLQRIYKATQNPYDRPQEIREEGGQQAPRERIRDRVPGQWSQDKADELGSKILLDLMKSEEGVKEFMALVGHVFGRDTVKAGGEEG